MEVTPSDLRAQCALQHDAFALCVQEAGGSEHASRCDAEKLALERCATATVQMIRRINQGCSGQYEALQACARQARRRGECGPQEEAFWKCAEPFTRETMRD
jgi:hypothetical protein